MSQLLKAVVTTLLSLFYENPADAPLWVVGLAIVFVIIFFLSLMAAFWLGCSRGSNNIRMQK